jgi:RNA polymerase sigma-70 factor (family 1)
LSNLPERYFYFGASSGPLQGIFGATSGLGQGYLIILLKIANLTVVFSPLPYFKNLLTIDDEWPDLHIGIATGDPAAFRRLIAIYFPVLCAFAAKYLPDSALVKDIVQEVFIKLWRQRNDFQSVHGFKGYLYTSVRNGCLNALRNKERLEARHNRAANFLESETVGVDQVITDIVESEYLALIYRAVRDLPEKMQQIFYLSYREGLSVKEISLQLHMNIKAVKRQKYRALVTLRRKLGGRQGALGLALLSAAVTFAA